MSERFIKTIKILGELSDSSLDEQASNACRTFDPATQDPVVFLRNLRDLCVRYSWGSGRIIGVITAMLSSAGADNEPPAQAEARRAQLEDAERRSLGIDYMLACTGAELDGDV